MSYRGVLVMAFAFGVSGAASNSQAADSLPAGHATSTGATVRSETGVAVERLAAALGRRHLRLVSLSRSLPGFTATYVLRQDETLSDAARSFSEDVAHISTELVQAGLLRETSSESPLSYRDIRVTELDPGAQGRDIAAFATELAAEVAVTDDAANDLHATAAHRPEPALTFCSDGITVHSNSAAFAPSKGSVLYTASSHEIFSFFSWTDTSWTTANGSVSYEHDIVVDGGVDDYVKWGPGTWASNLPNPYKDDPGSDSLNGGSGTTALTVGSYPATVQSGVTYWVRIPVQIVNASLGPRPLFLTPQLGSWQNRPCEFTYCHFLAPVEYLHTAAACVFSDKGVNDFRYYTDRTASSPLFSRINFESGQSWTYNWDTTYDFDAKVCPDSMYRGVYYNQKDLDADGAVARYVKCDGAINFAWGSQSPGLGIRNDLFSVQWTAHPNFNAGTHTFFLQSDDGSRLWIDGSLKLDAWHESGTNGLSTSQSLSEGNHQLRVDYYENGGDAHVLLQIQQNKPSPPGSVVASSPATGQIAVHWTDASSDETYFSVELRPANGSWSEVKTVAKNATSTTLTGLTGGASYGVRLRACNNSGCSLYSNEAPVTVQGSIPPTCYILTAYANPTAGGYPGINTNYNCSNIGYSNGTVINITANAYSGYQFANWTASNCSLASPNAATTTCTVNGTGAVSLTANFNSVPASTGTISVRALNNGAPWSGAISLTWTGPGGTQNISSLPASFSAAAPGTYTVGYVSGGPAGAMVSAVTPSATQGLTVGGVIEFVLSFVPLEPSVLAAGLNNPSDVAVDGSYVYWTEAWGDSGTVKKMPKGGGSVTLLAGSLWYPQALALDDTYVYFREAAESASIRRIPKGGGSVATVVSGQPSVWNLAVEGSSIYWTDGSGGTVRRAPLGGGGVSILASGLHTPSGIAVDSSSVYWSEWDFQGRVMAAALDGSSPRTLAFNAFSRRLALKGSYLYWIENAISNQGRIIRGATDSNGSIALASGLNNPRDVTTDGTNVFFVEDLANSAVKQVAASGGQVMVSTDGASHPIAVATDGAFVYWVEQGDGTSGTGKLKRTAVIATPKPNVVLAVSDANAREAGPDTGSLTVSRTGSTTDALVIAYNVGGTATDGTDYEHLSGTVTIPAGQSTASILITPIDDDALESAETIEVTLAADSAYTIGAENSGSVTIADNDAAITVTVPDATGGEVGSNTAAFSLVRTGSTSEALTVQYALTGTAANGTDYAEVPLTAVIAPGSSSVSVNIAPILDTAAEGDETVVLTLTKTPNYQLGTPAFGTVIISDAIAPPQNVIATAGTANVVNVSWTAVPGAVSYRVYRSSDVLTYSLVGAPTGASFQDSGVLANTTYLYKVRAFAGGESVDSDTDLATTTVFTDPDLAPGTAVKLLHFTELLTAINAVRTLAALPSLSFTAPPPAAGGPVLLQHLLDLRGGLDEARGILGLHPLAYTDQTPVSNSTTIKAAHLTEIRCGLK